MMTTEFAAVDLELLKSNTFIDHWFCWRYTFPSSQSLFIYLIFYEMH